MTSYREQLRKINQKQVNYKDYRAVKPNTVTYNYTGKVTITAKGTRAGTLTRRLKKMKVSLTSLEPKE